MRQLLKNGVPDREESFGIEKVFINGTLYIIVGNRTYSVLGL